jgi:hypothetical protein
VKVKKSQITVETYEVLIVRPDGQRQIWCAACERTVPALKPEEAAAVAGLQVRAIYRWVESETLHFTGSADGQLLICLTSLLQIVKETLP